MKKSIFTLVLAIFALNLAFGGQSDLFSYDSDALNNNLRDVEQLELYVVNNPNVTIADLQAEENILLNGLDLSANSSGMMASISGEPALGIPGFWWGCVLSWVGVLVVHLVAEDPAETKSAWWGCIVNGIAGGLGYTIPVLISGGLGCLSYSYY